MFAPLPPINAAAVVINSQCVRIWFQFSLSDCRADWVLSIDARGLAGHAWFGSVIEVDVTTEEDRCDVDKDIGSIAQVYPLGFA